MSENQKAVQEALFEVISSEASYLKSLNILISHFVQSPQFSGIYIFFYLSIYLSVKILVCYLSIIRLSNVILRYLPFFYFQFKITLDDWSPLPTCFFVITVFCVNNWLLTDHDFQYINFQYFLCFSYYVSLKSGPHIC